MENIDLTQTVSGDTINYLGGVAVLIISAILVLMVIFFKRYKARFIPLVMGVFGYVLLAYFGYNIIITLIFAIPGAELAYTNNTTVFQIIFLVIFVAMFTAARIISMNIMSANYNRPGDVLIFGLGIGMCDALLYLLSSLTLVVMATGINNSGMTELFKDFTETDLINTYNSISLLFTAPSILWLLLAFSSIFDIFLNCGLAVLTFGVVSKKIPTWWYAVSAGINFIVVLPFKLYDASSEMGVILPFAIKTVFFVVALYGIYKIDTNEIGGIISYTGKNDNFNKTSSMPKFGKLSK